MKKSYHKMLGVTLLEIMLVLAIAALVIIMSIRFYQTASTTNKVNAAMTSIQSVVAAGENFLTSGGSTDKITTGITPYLPGGQLPKSPWTGAPVSLAAGSSVGQYTITMDSPGAAPQNASTPTTGSPCSQLAVQLHQNPALGTPACGSGKIVVTVSTF